MLGRADHLSMGATTPLPRRALLVAVVLTTLGVMVGLALPVGPSAGAASTGPSAAATIDAGAAEAEFTARINQLRASRGLGALSTDPELTREARTWAATMANAGRIFHTSNLSSGITANWAKLGENVGVGGRVDVLFQAFVDSPTDYENIVDPRYTRVGVGVVVVGDRMFTAHRFMGLAEAPPPPPPTTAPPATAPPTTAPPATAPPTSAPPTTLPPPPPTTATPTTAAPVRGGAAPPKLGPVERIGELLADA